MNSVFKALTGVILGFFVLSSIAAVNRLVKHPALEIEDYLEVVGDPAKTNRIGGAGTIMSNWLALSGTTNRLTDDGQQLLRNGQPIGGFTTNVFNMVITTNIQVLNIAQISNTFVTNLTVYEIATFATNITIEQFITLKQNSTLVFTNNTYVTTNTFLFVNSTGAVVGVELEAGDGISITAGTNISANLEAGTGITLATNAGVISITSSTSEIWDNTGGVIAPAGGQDTNVLRFTSGLASNSTNNAIVIDTASTWTSGRSLTVRNNGTNTMSFGPKGGLLSGRLAESQGAPNDDWTIYRNLEAGEGSFDLYVETTQTASEAIYGFYALYVDDDGVGEIISLAANGEFVQADVAPGSARIQAGIGSTSLDLNPTVSDGATAYRFGTSAEHTGGNLSEFENNSVDKFSIAFDGTITAAGSANITSAINANSGVITNNLGALLSVGDTTFVDLSKGSQTNAVSGALAFAHATNGVHGVDQTHVRWLFNGSGSDQTLTIPSGWRTNVYSAVPPALTNGTITRMVLACGGATASAAAQTNVYVSFEFYK